MANTPYQYINPPADYKPSPSDAQDLASFLVREDMAMTGDSGYGIPPSDNSEEIIELTARTEVFNDLKTDSPPSDRWLAFHLQKMIDARRSGDIPELPFDDKMSQKAYSDALISYIEHAMYDLERGNAFREDHEWHPGERKLYEAFQKLLKHTMEANPDDSPTQALSVGSMPDMSPPSVKDAKIGKGSMRPNSNADMKELRDALPPGVSPGQSGYKSRYSG